MEIERQTVSVDEAAKILGIGRATAYAAIKQGTLPYLRIGEKRIVIPLAALRKLLEGSG